MAKLTIPEFIYDIAPPRLCVVAMNTISQRATRFSIIHNQAV